MLGDDLSLHVDNHEIKIKYGTFQGMLSENVRMLLSQETKTIKFKNNEPGNWRVNLDTNCTFRNQIKLSFNLVRDCFKNPREFLDDRRESQR